MPKPFDIKTDVTLECPQCRSYKTILRPLNIPSNVRLIEIICPDCDDGDRHHEVWFSAPGIEVSQNQILPDSTLQGHYCAEWDFDWIDNTMPEFDVCICYKQPKIE